MNSTTLAYNGHHMLREFLTDPFSLAVAAWLAVIIAVIAIFRPEIAGLLHRLRGRWQERTELQSSKDRKNYDVLLGRYQKYLDILENLIIVRAQLERGSEGFTPEMRQQLQDTRDGVYHDLEKRGEDEKDMGTFQLFEVLEERMVGIADQCRKREDLEARQAEIEDHPLFKTL